MIVLSIGVFIICLAASFGAGFCVAKLRKKKK